MKKLVLAIIILLLLDVLFIAIFCPVIPKASEDFTCLDASRFMQQHFVNWGINSTIIIGDLSRYPTTQSQYIEHAWLIVHLGAFDIAYDWGQPQFNREYYEGGKGESQ